MRLMLLLAGVLCAAMTDVEREWMNRVDYQEIRQITDACRAAGKPGCLRMEPGEWNQVLAGRSQEAAWLMQRRHRFDGGVLQGAGINAPPDPNGVPENDSPQEPGGNAAAPTNPGSVLEKRSSSRQGGKAGGGSAAAPGNDGASARDGAAKEGGANGLKNGAAGEASGADQAGLPENERSQSERQIQRGDVEQMQSKLGSMQGGAAGMFGPEKTAAAAMPAGAAAGARSAPPATGPRGVSRAPFGPAAQAGAPHLPSGTGAAVAAPAATGRDAAGTPQQRAVRHAAAHGYMAGYGANPDMPRRYYRGHESVPLSARGGGAVQRVPGVARTERAQGGAGQEVELTPEEEAELESFLQMLEEAADGGVMDSDSINSALTAAESRLVGDEPYAGPLGEVREVMEKAGRPLHVPEREEVRGSLGSVGLKFAPSPFGRFIRALERAEAPPPRQYRELTLWQRIVRACKLFLLKIARFFGVAPRRGAR